jgi:adenylate cyclase
MEAGQSLVGFGEFGFNPASGELWKAGRAVRLTPRASSVLRVLVARAPELVGKAELIAAVWQVNAVTDDALTACIREIRQALGDDARRPRYVETRHKRGFRLVASLARPSASATAASSGKPSLAVLPFDNLSAEPDRDYFVDGIVEDMTMALGRIGTFFVMARNSSFAFRGRKVPMPEVGRQLGVRYIVDGSIRRSGQKLRLTAQLIEAETGHHLWADRYDGELTDVFDLQDRIVTSIVAAISPSVRTAEIERARLKRPDSLGAYDHLLRAYPGFWSLVDPGHAEAVGLFHKAIELEPAYALAMALAAWGHAQRFSRSMPGDPIVHRRQAGELANAAIGLSPDDPSVLMAAGMALFLVNPAENVDRSASIFRKALELDPNAADGWRRLGTVHLFRSEPAEAIAAFERAVQLSPLDPMKAYNRFGIADALFIEERLPEALQLYRDCLSERPHDPAFRRRICAVFALSGEIDQARSMAQALQDDYPNLTLEQIAAASPLFPAPSRERYLQGLRLAGFS